MNVQAVNNTGTTAASARPKSVFNPVKITGYATLGFGIASGIAGAKKKIKIHTKLAYLSGILAVIHTGLVEWHHYQRKKTAQKG